MLFVLSFVATAHAEYGGGVFTVTQREPEWNNGAMLYVTGGGSGPAPSSSGTEYYCAANTFRWPQVIASGSPATVASWTVLAVKDSNTTNPTCADVQDNSTKYTRSFEPCTAGGTCPAISGSGPWTAQASSTPLLSLKPGLYHVTSRRDAAGTRTTGNADVFVRPTANANVFVETWCYNANFIWPRTKINVSGTDYERIWWDYGVDATNSAPATVTCPGGTTRADFKYTVD